MSGKQFFLFISIAPFENLGFFYYMKAKAKSCTKGGNLQKN